MCRVNALADIERAVRASMVRIGAVEGGYDGRSGGDGTDGTVGSIRTVGDTERRRRGTLFWGSGFFVAPGWVLTCAHVLGKGAAPVWRGEQAIGITIGDRPDAEVRTGELAFALPTPEDPHSPPLNWSLPDLALIRVPDTEDADCLWLSDRSVPAPARIGLYGWMPGPERGGEPLLFSGGGSATGGSSSRHPLHLSGAQLTEGCSGGPVIDVGRGAVIGVSKSKSRDPGGSGMASPVTALRELCDAGPRGARVLHEVVAAHDRHHLRRYQGPGDSWPRLHARLGPGAGEAAHGFTADRRAALYGLFAELEPPATAGEVLQLANEARDVVLEMPYDVREHAPRTWREGAGLLYDPRDGHTPEDAPARDLALEAVVLYAAHVYATLARGAAAPVPAHTARALSGLREWTAATALLLSKDLVRAKVTDILAGHATVISEPADVLVEIDADIYGTGKHSWRVIRVRGAEECGESGARALTTLAQSREDAPRTRLEESVRGALSLALDQCDVGEHLAAVEFMLPRALFDEPVDQWRARPYDPDDPYNPHTLPLGQRRLVVLRDRLRKDHGITPEWVARWAGVAAGPLEAVPLRAEVPWEGHGAARPESGQATYGRLQEAPVGAVPVYCARTGEGPGARAMAAALAAGHAVALWRHVDDREGSHADCEEFHARAAELLREAHSAQQLPGRMRTLRTGYPDGEVTEPGSAWARHLVLLYDPPHRDPRDGPLREPPLMPGQSAAERSTS